MRILHGWRLGDLHPHQLQAAADRALVHRQRQTGALLGAAKLKKVEDVQRLQRRGRGIGAGVGHRRQGCCCMQRQRRSADPSCYSCERVAGGLGRVSLDD